MNKSTKTKTNSIYEQLCVCSLKPDRIVTRAPCVDKSAAENSLESLSLRDGLTITTICTLPGLCFTGFLRSWKFKMLIPGPVKVMEM